jgi:hypothetical protein
MSPYKTRFQRANTGFKNSRTRLFSRLGLRGLLLATGILALLISGLSMYAAPPSSPAINLDQASNGGIGQPPISPVGWENGNQNGQKAHYNEGESIPYRARITGLTPGLQYRATFGYDVTHGGGHAIDYITSNDRITEIVNPCRIDGAAADDVSPCVAGAGGTIPAPATGTTAQNVANASFNSVVANEGLQEVSIFNGSVNLVERLTQGDLSLAQSESTFRVTFTASAATTVLSWGGHIARAADWSNFGGSATTISGSPFHTRTKSLDVPQGQGFKTISIGNQDRALASSAVNPPAACQLSNDGARVCGATTTRHELLGAADTGSTYAFTFVSGSGSVVKNENPSAAGCTDGDPSTPCIYADVTASGTYTIRLTTSTAAGSEICEATVTIDQAPSAADVADQEVCNTGAPSDLVFTVNSAGSVVPTGGSLTWSIQSGTAAIGSANAASTTITLSGSGSVTVRLTVAGPAGSSCQPAFNDAVLTANAPPTVSISLENACNSATSDLRATASGGSGNLVYAWTKDGNPVGTNSATLPVSGIGTYAVTVSDGKSCSGAATKKLCFDLQNAP